MVEHGKVKVFFGSRSHNKGMYGFVRVLDDNGEPTGEELFFHLNAARELYYDLVNRSVHFSDRRMSASEPQKGQFIAFERDEESDRPQAVAWTFKERWGAAEALLTEEREFEWRIVITTYVATGITQNMGEVDESGYDEILGTACNGSMTCTIRELRHRTAHELGFHEYYYDEIARGYDTNSASLQVRLDGKWHTLTSIKPIFEPDDPDDWYPDDSDSEIDDDSRREFEHGRKLGMY